MSHITLRGTCHMTPTPVTCQMSLTSTATATDPLQAYSLTMLSRLVGKDPQTNIHLFPDG